MAEPTVQRSGREKLAGVAESGTGGKRGVVGLSPVGRGGRVGAWGKKTGWVSESVARARRVRSDSASLAPRRRSRAPGRGSLAAHFAHVARASRSLFSSQRAYHLGQDINPRSHRHFSKDVTETMGILLCSLCHMFINGEPESYTGKKRYRICLELVEHWTPRPVNVVSRCKPGKMYLTPGKTLANKECQIFAIASICYLLSKYLPPRSK